MANALSGQVGGGHYKDAKIQPLEFIHANNIPFSEASAIKYLFRHASKNKAQDVKKAIHFSLLILEMTYGIKVDSGAVLKLIDDAEKQCQISQSSLPPTATPSGSLAAYYSSKGLIPADSALSTLSSPTVAITTKPGVGPIISDAATQKT